MKRKVGMRSVIIIVLAIGCTIYPESHVRPEPTKPFSGKDKTACESKAREYRCSDVGECRCIAKQLPGAVR